MLLSNNQLASFWLDQQHTGVITELIEFFPYVQDLATFVERHMR